MIDILTFIAIVIVCIFAAFIGSMVGGGGLISIPFLIFVGVPAQIAVATNKFGGIGLSFGSLPAYWKSKQIQWCYVLPFSIIAFVAALIGANILISFPAQLLEEVIGVILLLLLPILLIEKRLGITQKKISPTMKAIGYILFFLIEIWGAFFGAGSAVALFFVLMSFFGFTIIQASATTKIPGLVLGITSIVIYATNGIIDYWVGLAIFIGMLIGGHLGASTAVLKGNKWVKVIFMGIVLASAIKLLVF